MSTGHMYRDEHLRRVPFGSAESNEGGWNMTAVVPVISVSKSVAKPHLSWYFIVQFKEENLIEQENQTLAALS